MNKIVQISKYLPVVISTRDSIRRLFETNDLPSFQKVVFDFSEINFISRSAADELIKLINNYSIKEQFIHVNENIDSMFNAVRYKNKSREEIFTVTEFTTQNELIQFLETF